MKYLVISEWNGKFFPSIEDNHHLWKELNARVGKRVGSYELTEEQEKLSLPELVVLADAGKLTRFEPKKTKPVVKPSNVIGENNGPS